MFEKLVTKTFAKTMIKTFAKADVAIVFANEGGGFGKHRPWDICVKKGCESSFFSRVVLLGSLGFGKSYVDGTFECGDLAGTIRRLLSFIHERQSRKPRMFGMHMPSSLPEAWIKLQLQIPFWNAQSIDAAAAAIKHHYDAGNDFYGLVLGPTRVYSCGFFFGTNDNDEAQANKYLHTVSKLDIDRVPDPADPSKRWQVIEIGCGWGWGLALAAKTYPHATFHGFTISKEQHDHAEKTHADLIAQGRLKFYLMDYRRIPKKFPKGFFDRGFSIGMFEHVGPKNYRKPYARVVRYCVKEGQPFVLHTIVGNGGIGPFIWYYIFPGGILPTGVQIERAFTRNGFVTMHRENLGKHYATTIRGWRVNLHKHWGKLREMGYPEEFLRTYDFYFAGCEFEFELGMIQLEQWTVAVNGMDHGFNWRVPEKYAA